MILWYNGAMTPKITDDMRNALKKTGGQPVEVDDPETGMPLLLMPKAAWEYIVKNFLSSQEAESPEKLERLRLLIKEGDESGDGIPAEKVFLELERYVDQLSPKKS